MPRHLFRLRLAFGAFPAFAGSTLAAQMPEDIARERTEYQAWLTNAPTSPLAAIARQAVADELRLGPAGSDIPLPGLKEHRVFPDGRALVLETPAGKRLVRRDRPIRLGPYTLLLAGAPAGTALTVFGTTSRKQPPGYYPYDPSLVFTGPLIPPEGRARVRVLSADGLETEAGEAGSVVVPLGGETRLRVLRFAGANDEESELEIFFQDGTNGKGSYPAGRFVSLIPVPGGKYRLDFNRARNPFCAYSSVYPCPAPWRGNVLSVPVRAGERYTGGGLEAPPVIPQEK
jgi:hypothetical protein